MKIGAFFKSIFCDDSKPKLEDALYYEMPFEFNTSWVSLDYPENHAKTADIIKRMYYGEEITLEWSDKPFRDDEHIKVFSAMHKQIGWAAGVSKYFETAVKESWPIDARLKLKGKVDDPKVNIWWAVVEGTFKIPFPSDSTMVFIPKSGSWRRYHSTENCGKSIKKQIPLSLAVEFGYVPCPHCIGGNQ